MLDGWMDGWMDWWMDGWMDGWIGGKEKKITRGIYFFKDAYLAVLVLVAAHGIFIASYGFCGAWTF